MKKEYEIGNTKITLEYEEQTKQETEKNVTGLGRWGEHQHYNADVVVERALRLAETMGREDDE